MKMIKPLILMATVIVGGTVGFASVEQWSYWQSLYFTLITVTTVGYGDEGLSEEGRKFATLVLLGGVAAFSYSLATIVQISVAHQLAWRKRMQKKIDRLSGHTIICGYGRMGISVVTHLEEQGAPFVLIERDPAAFQRAVDRGYLALEGKGTDDEMLLAAGIERASHIIGGVDSVADNMVIAMSARELNPDLVIIARAETDGDTRKLRRAGVDRLLCPFRSGGREVADLITKPRVADFLARASTGRGDLVLAEVEVEEDSGLVGVTVAEHGRREGSRISYVALDREGEGTTIPPRGVEVLRAGDRLIVAGDPEQINAMMVRATTAGHAGEAAA